MDTISHNPNDQFLCLALPAQPLFLRTTAPALAGEAAVYTMTFLQRPVCYGVHWLTQPNGPTERRQCKHAGCPWCADGHSAQEMYAALVIDHDNERLVIAQMSAAAATSVARALTDFVSGQGAANPVLAFGVNDDARQPVITLRAVRSENGPRYSAKAALRDFTCDPSTGEPLGLAPWFDTDGGADWLMDALIKSSPALYGYAKRPEAFDPLRFIWPDGHAATEDDDD